MDIKIRPLTAEDSAAFTDLRIRVIEDSPLAAHITPQEEAALPKSQAAHRIGPDSTRIVFGAFSNNQLVGTVGVRRQPFWPIAHKAELWSVIVAPDKRRQGIAHKLMQSAIDYAQDIEEIVQLSVYGVNTLSHEAIRLYESLGFISFGVEPRTMRFENQYYDGQYMVLKLR